MIPYTVMGGEMEQSEIRKDYFLDRYVIIAPKRNKRPGKIIKKEEKSDKECYFCPAVVDQPGREKTIYEKKDSSGKWQIKVIKNKFPAVELTNPKAYGEQEIVIETPEHNKELQDLPLAHIVDVLNVYIERYKELQKIEGISYTLVFKNEGGKAGASQPHAHSQIYALPVIPPKIADESAAMDDYIRKHNSCPYCDIIKAEEGGPREIYSDDHLFVVAPYASESAYGAWFIPKRHVHSMDFLNDEEKKSLAVSLKKILTKLDEIDVAYNYFFLNSLDLESHHMVLKLAPRPNIWAGLELGTGVILNPVPPEDAAKFYKE